MTDTAVWTIRETLNWMARKFTELDLPTPLLDAQLMLCQVLSLQKVELYVQIDRPLLGTERAVLRDLVRRRMAGEPVAYLQNRKAWHDLDLYVDRNVLIPRPETETLLDFVLSVCAQQQDTSPKIIVDLCTGSGCLAIALARKFPDATVIAVDNDEAALNVARRNAADNKAERIHFLNADVCDAKIYQKILSEFGLPDILVANPPYVTEEEWKNLDISVRDFEPRNALVAAENGLAIGRRILNLSAEAGFFESGKMIFAVELAEHQPSRLCAEEGLGSLSDFKILSSSLQPLSFPRASFFGMKDLDGRARFLCRLS